MSSFLQIVATNLSNGAGFTEQLVSWGGEEFPADPRRLAFKSVGGLLLPIPAHVRALLPAELAHETAGVQLADDVVNSWAADRCGSQTYADLRSLFEGIAASGPYAIIYEAGSGSGTQTLMCERQ